MKVGNAGSGVGTVAPAGRADSCWGSAIGTVVVAVVGLVGLNVRWVFEDVALQANRTWE